MARQYYFKSWTEAQLFIEHLEIFDVAYDVECGVNVVDEGYDNLVTVLDESSVDEDYASILRAYPYEQYEQDRAKAIAEGTDPRLIMSYTATLSSMVWEAEQEREAEIWESYDEAMAELEREEAEREIAAEVAERDEIIEMAEMAEEAAMVELEQFGCIEFEEGVPWQEWRGESCDALWEFAEHEFVWDELF